MRVSVIEAEGQLKELVRRAEAGDEVILTQHGQPAVRLVPVKRVTDESFWALIKEVQEETAKTAMPGPSAARSQDFLYDEDGLPK
jgi:prevent-host-death family protein